MVVWFILLIIEPLQVVLLCSTLDCGNMGGRELEEVEFEKDVEVIMHRGSIGRPFFWDS